MMCRTVWPILICASLLVSGCGKSDGDKAKKTPPGNKKPPAKTTPDAAKTATKPKPKRNLKVLPHTLSKKALKRLMKRQAKALGMDCSDCHDTDDFAADTEDNKKVARKMMRMTDRLNAGFFKDGDRKLTCFTCHQGQNKPKQQKGHYDDGHTH